LAGTRFLTLAGEKDKDEIVSAEAIAKAYAEGKEAFDKVYKGKSLVVEGVVSNSSVKDGGKTFLLLDGYVKPGDKFSHIVRFVEQGPDFEGIRLGHKVRIRGTVQEHKDNLVAVELRDCKVVKVTGEGYPPSKEVRAEVKKLQGRWKVSSQEANGKKLTGDEAPFTAVSVEGYNLLLHQGNQLLPFGLLFDLGKEPKQVDLIGRGATLPSIYLLDGDNMKLFLPAILKKGGFQRAGAFDTVKHGGVLLKLERQK
jgi:uncharacterized protein (TIGR03067 family)